MLGRCCLLGEAGGGGLPGTEQVGGGGSRERKATAPEAWRKSSEGSKPNPGSLSFSQVTLPPLPPPQKGQAVTGEGRKTPGAPRSISAL